LGRKVTDGGHATGQGAAGAEVEVIGTLAPYSCVEVVEMNVAVNTTGEDVRAGSIDGGRSIGDFRL